MPEPIDFPEKNAVFKGDGGAVGDLPCFVDKEMTISCWKLTKEEIVEIIENGVIYVGAMNYGKPLQPQAIWVKNPFFAVPTTEQPEGAQ